MTLRAAVLTRLGAPLEVRDGITAPDLAPGQALVKIAYSGVCHSQLMERAGARGPDPWLPHLLGHEATGRVLATGDAVTKVAPGDLVVLGWIRGQGAECGGCAYDHAGETLNAGGVTTFATHAVVSENRLVRLPDGMPLDLGVLLGCALPTGAGLVLNELNPAPGSTVAVFGLGGIGLSALMAARTCAPGLLIAVDVADDKLALAREIGADLVIDARETDPVEAIRAAAAPGADFCVDASGRTAVIEQAFLASHPKHGLTIFASHPAAGEKISLDPHHLISGRRIQGSWGGACDPDRDIPRLAALYTSGQLPLELFRAPAYPLDRVNEAMDDLHHGRVLRPILEIDPDV